YDGALATKIGNAKFVPFGFRPWDDSASSRFLLFHVVHQDFSFPSGQQKAAGRCSGGVSTQKGHSDQGDWGGLRYCDDRAGSHCLLFRGRSSKGNL
ncbi:MAG: hypothetical protein WBX25_35460, partial [Rhodomicrobium sp.]